MKRSTWKTRIAAVGLAGAVLAGEASVARAADKAAAPAAHAADHHEAAAAAAPNTLTDQEKAAGWRLLFDGKTTEGWRNYTKETVSDKWKVQDGTLALTGAGGGDLITKDQYDSYELTLDFKISPKGNSGLIYHVQEVKGKPPYDSGPEIQIQDNAGGDPQKAGWLYQLYPPPNDEKTGKPIDATKPVGEWNTLRFVLNGPKGEIHMNGVKYSAFEMGSDDWNQRLAKSKFATWPNFAKAKKGHICLQDHGNVVAFRNIKIRPIAGHDHAAH